MNLNQFQIFFVICFLTLLLFGFNNCGQGFESIDSLQEPDFQSNSEPNDSGQNETEESAETSNPSSETPSSDPSPIPPDEIFFPDQPTTAASKELCEVSEQDSLLKKEARDLGLGQWKVLKTTWDADSEREFFFHNPYPQDRQTGANHISWADTAGWDPESSCLYFYGSGAKMQPAFIRLCESDLKWTYGPRPSAIDYDSLNYWDWTGHAYDNNALDPIRGIHFYPKNNQIHSFDISSGQWSVYADQPILKLGFAKSALEYFPGLGLVQISQTSAGKVSAHVYNETIQQWTLIQEDIKNIWGSNFAAQYNPQSETLIFGGGIKSALQSNLYSLNKSGELKEVKSPPTRFYTGHSNNLGIFVDDPASGNFLYLDSSQIFEYQTDRDEWRRRQTPSIDLSRARIASSIPEYGVVVLYVYRVGLVLHNSSRGPCP